jgi:hypothetical protein
MTRQCACLLQIRAVTKDVTKTVSQFGRGSIGGRLSECAGAVPLPSVETSQDKA